MSRRPLRSPVPSTTATLPLNPLGQKGRIMSDIDATSSNEPQLTAEVTATGTAPRPTDLIAPEHKHHADAILAMDPMQIPRPYDIPEGWAANLTLRATALPPEMQRTVTAKVAALGNLTPEQRSAKEAEFTANVIRSQRSNLIVQGGVGRDATPYHRELASIAREVSRPQARGAIVPPSS